MENPTASEPSICSPRSSSGPAYEGPAIQSTSRHPTRCHRTSTPCSAGTRKEGPLSGRARPGTAGLSTKRPCPGERPPSRALSLSRTPNIPACQPGRERRRRFHQTCDTRGLRVMCSGQAHPLPSRSRTSGCASPPFRSESWGRLAALGREPGPLATPPVDRGGSEELLLRTMTHEPGGQADCRENNQDSAKRRFADREQQDHSRDIQSER